MSAPMSGDWIEGFSGEVDFSIYCDPGHTFL